MLQWVHEYSKQSQPGQKNNQWHPGTMFSWQHKHSMLYKAMISRGNERSHTFRYLSCENDLNMRSGHQRRWPMSSSVKNNHWNFSSRHFHWNNLSFQTQIISSVLQHTHSSRTCLFCLPYQLLINIFTTYYVLENNKNV